MHPYAALIAAGHLEDLRREAEEERRRKLFRSGRPKRARRTLSVGRRVTGLIRRLLRQPAGTSRQEPACV